MSLIFCMEPKSYHAAMSIITNDIAIDDKMKIIQDVSMDDWALDKKNILFLSDRHGHNSKIYFDTYMHLVHFLYKMSDI